jgi:hypothetical protein
MKWDITRGGHASMVSRRSGHRIRLPHEARTSRNAGRYLKIPANLTAAGHFLIEWPDFAASLLQENTSPIF